MIGLSLSFCVSDIADGIVDESEVDKIIAGTCACDDIRIDELMSGYNEIYWDERPTAESIARRLLEAGKVEQPRCEGKQHPGYSQANYRKYWIK